ncbi:MAG: lysine--tRNA ligase [Pseudomonadota bacterium]
MNTETNDTSTTENVDENKLIKQRREKLSELRKLGNPFPNNFRRDALAGDLQLKYSSLVKEEVDNLHIKVKISGRMMLQRIMGKASFVQIKDMSGSIQVYVQRDALAEGFYNEQFKRWDLGDIIAVEGELFKTNKDELSVRVSVIQLLTKSLRPLPEKFKGLTDNEIKYRQRYIDLIMNDETRKTFQLRSKIVQYIREFLHKKQFMEVETPMMQAIPGGATAKPFTTFHNALDMELYLRIAPELYLKRLVVGGFEKVFEINRNFRNEGLSTRHNPEFTMIEFYQAYADYHDLMDLTEEMLKGISSDLIGNTTINYQGTDLDFAKPFDRMTVKESILHFNKDITEQQLDDREQAKAIAERLEIPLKEIYGLGKIQIEIFEKTVEYQLINPTFITAYPTEVSPLARRSDDNPFVTDRFEFFVGGREIANGFSELNDAEDQASRFQAQVAEKDAGDDEAMHYDEDYITALEYGLPPTAGEGIGIDRLVMLFTDSPSIRDVLLFPQMKKQ